jgi:hypothetical protein
MRHLLILIGFTLLAVGDCIACEVAPKEKQIGELVSSNAEIVLAELARVTRETHEYTFHFKVLQNLKGTSPAEIQMTSCCNFVSTDTDCTIHPGGFALGGRYLLFLTKPYDYKSFKPVVGDHDEWLLQVRTKITEQRGNR